MTHSKPSTVRRLRDRLLGLDAALALHRRIAGHGSIGDFAAAALRDLDVCFDQRMTAPDPVAASGPAIFVCNHPFGVLDGLIALATVGAIRPDLRLLASDQLCQLPELAAVLFPLDPHQRRSSCQKNANSMRRALRWVRNGGALLVFPAGEVSRLRLSPPAVTDRPWPESMGQLVRLSGAPVTPLHIDGRNSGVFLALSLLLRQLGTPLLVREMFRKRGTHAIIHIGATRLATRLAGFKSDLERIAYLRLKSDTLRALPTATVTHYEAVREPSTPPMASSPVDLVRELEQLPAASCLLQSGPFSVYCLRAAQAPGVMHEIATLRERCFRAVGEGTGNDIDRDLYDNFYEQLVLWDRERGEIAGGYRICRISDVRRHYGTRGLYTHTLFEYRDAFFTLLGPALELGRSFVAPDYQRSFAPLALLWRAIGEYVGRHPECCRLLGPVSISNAYQLLSREVLVDFLRASCLDPVLSRLVRPRLPFRRRGHLQPLDRETLRSLDLAGVSTLLSEHEADAKGVPVLLRQYLKMGGRILGFNVDHSFSNALDCLLLVDLRRTDPKLLQRYFSDEVCRQLAKAHRPALRLKSLVRRASAN